MRVVVILPKATGEWKLGTPTWTLPAEGFSGACGVLNA